MSAHAPVPLTKDEEDKESEREYTLALTPYLYVDRGKSGARTTDVPGHPTQPRPPRDSGPAGPRAIELFPDTGWIERASHAAPSPTVPDERGSLAQLRELLDRKMEYMFLRQFRDPNQTAKASYQAIIMGGIVPGSSPGATWNATVDKENYVLRFPELAEGAVPNPIAQSLGIPGEIEADGAVRLKNLDVRVNAANIVWDRS